MSVGEAKVYATELFVAAVNAKLADAKITEAEALALVPVIREEHAQLMRLVVAQFQRRRATVH